MNRNHFRWSVAVVLSLSLTVFVSCGGDSEEAEGSDITQDNQAQADGTVETDTLVETDTVVEPADSIEEDLAADVPVEEAYVPPVTDYPEGPFGKIVGTVIKNHVFLNPESGKALQFASLYKHPKKKVLLINSSAGWCGYCKQEAYELREVYSTYGSKGLEIWFTLFQDYEGGPATVDFWDAWMSSMAPTYPTLLDTAFEMGGYFNVDATPMNMIIDLSTMEIVYLQTGYDKVGMLNKLDQLLQ